MLISSRFLERERETDRERTKKKRGGGGKREGEREKGEKANEMFKETRKIEGSR